MRSPWLLPRILIWFCSVLHYLWFATYVGFAFGWQCSPLQGSFQCQPYLTLSTTTLYPIITTTLHLIFALGDEAWMRMSIFIHCVEVWLVCFQGRQWNHKSAWDCYKSFGI
ncbi:uncharacterized protein LOC106753195 isoform X2 [Vigna radiata var. radiata]|uniref:Uncharacterized protein LOC106753195 isoform X2 n=1 Tax=Vigna radiata var. radiata TaxID=3916 RepID=A0A3Q0EPW4_VIGRR|nr:uncharacterized protein LOC106753195 isoform X2 [Vigna radiata var. radiata]